LSATTKVSIVVIAGLCLVVGGLFLVVAVNLHQGLIGSPPRPSAEYGFSQAFRIFTNASSPFGTRASFWAVLLALSGILVVPAMIGGVAGIVLGEIVARANYAEAVISEAKTADADAKMLSDAAAAAVRLAKARRELAAKTPQPAAGSEGPGVQTIENTADADAQVLADASAAALRLANATRELTPAKS
jgi:hypothetical protein